MKSIFWTILIIYSVWSFESNAAKVTAMSQTQVINFGKISAGTSIGTVPSGCGSPTGGVKIISGCQNGSFTVTATTTNTNNNGRRVRIILTRPTSLTGSPSGSLASALTITSPLPSGCTQITAGTVIECTDAGGAIGNVRNWVIPVYGALNSIATNQATANYSGSYAMRACSCCVSVDSQCAAAGAANGCTSSLSDVKCTNINLSKSFSGSVPARIITPLSIVENTSLNFGTVVPSVSGPSTVNQNGTVLTGSATQISSLSQFSGNFPSAGKFTVSGEALSGIPYSFNLPTSTVLSCSGGGCSGAPNMNVSLSFSAGSSLRTLNVSGNDVVNVNGVLTVGQNQQSGNYSGTYNVVVNY